MATVYLSLINDHVVACKGSVVLTQTHPAAPYVCKTGNIALRCQYDGVENVFVCAVAYWWSVYAKPMTPGHTDLLPLPSTRRYIYSGRQLHQLG